MPTALLWLETEVRRRYIAGDQDVIPDGRRRLTAASVSQSCMVRRLQRSLVRRPCMNPLEKAQQFRPSRVESAALRRGLEREAHLDVRGTELAAGEPLVLREFRLMKSHCRLRFGATIIACTLAEIARAIVSRRTASAIARPCRRSA